MSDIQAVQKAYQHLTASRLLIEPYLYASPTAESYSQFRQAILNSLDAVDLLRSAMVAPPSQFPKT